MLCNATQVRRRGIQIARQVPRTLVLVRLSAKVLEARYTKSQTPPNNRHFPLPLILQLIRQPATE